MTDARLLWTEYPYQAGFCVTDDTDDATLGQTKAVYDFLIAKDFVTTKTVWPFHPSEPSGIPATPSSTLRGITLEDAGYRDYCVMLAERGFEISLHSASAGNNKRHRMAEAFEVMERSFGGSSAGGASGTFICHSKNAENIYWGSKVTKLFPFNLILRYLDRHDFGGEKESGDYFWGDMCRSKIDQIRLYRTRCVNTLKRNPSMPYHDSGKHFVNSWFSATKRRIADCATPAALRKLQEENGLTVLYQYLHRYADPVTLELNRGFVDAVEAITLDPGIHVATVSRHMQRLRMIRGVFVVCDGDNHWMVNTNDAPIRNLQFALSDSTDVKMESAQVYQRGDRLVIPDIPGRGSVYFRCPEKFGFKKCRVVKIPTDGELGLDLDGMRIRIFVPDIGQLISRPATVDFELDSYATTNQKLPTKSASLLEEYRLILEQLYIIAREILFKGRSLDSNKFLDANHAIPLENHDNW